MGKHLYTTPRKVVEFHDNYVKTTKKYPEFPETLRLMKEQGACSEKPLPMPALHGNMTKEEFKEAYDDIPIEVTKILNAIQSYMVVQEKYIFPDDRDVYCVRHEHNFGSGAKHLDTFFSVTYIFEGHSNLMFGNEKLELEAGDICIIAPNSMYFIQPFAKAFAFEAIVRSSSFNVLFNELITSNTVMSDFFRNALLNRDRENYFLMKADKDDNEIRWYLQTFVCECMNNSEFANVCAISLMKLFLATAFRKYGDTARMYHDDSHNYRIDASQILQYISNNYRDISLAQTADYFHYNRTYLSRFIHAHFHKSFMELVTELKINHAKEYLKNSNKRVSDIALLVGYDSTDHFSRTFKRLNGIAPAEYRRRHLAQLEESG